MDDLNHVIQPGKLKRKQKRSSSSASISVVDLPAVPASPSSGNLLGEAFFDQSSQGASASGSILSLANDIQKSYDDVKELDLKALDSDDETFPSKDASKEAKQKAAPTETATLRDLAPKAPKPLSPLDLLKTGEDELLIENIVPQPRPIRVVRVDENGNVDESAAKAPQTPSTSFKRKTLKPKPAAAPEVDIVQDTSKLEDVLAQSHDVNQKCLDTLARLQMTNTQNERRYVAGLTLGFIILCAVVVIAVVVGLQLANSTKEAKIKNKQDSYENILKSNEFLEAEFEKEKNGSNAAFEVYQRIEQGQFEDAVERFTAVRNQLTHPVEIALLEQKIDEIRWKLAENAYHDGVVLFNASNYEQARDAFYKSLSRKENTDYTPRLYYYLAMALYQLGDYDGARRYFSQITLSNLSSEMEANARFYRASAAEKLGDNDDAFDQYEQFLKKFKYHRLADEAVKRRSRVQNAMKTP